MCKRLIFLISFVLVLSIGSSALAEIPEPVGFWRFEGDYTDSGTGGNDGTAEGSATIVLDAVHGKVLSLDGFGWVSIASGVTELGNLDFTIAAWILVPDEVVDGPGGCILSKSDGGIGWTGNEKQFYINEEEAGEGGFNGTADYVGWGCDWIRGGQRVDDDTWHHVCVTWDHEGAEGHLYVDGVDDTNAVGYFEGQGDNEGDTVRIGFSPGQHSVNFEGRIDDVAIFDVTLTAEEVFELAGGIAGAKNPRPKDEQERVDPEGLLLTWTPDLYSATEHIYFSSNPDDVSNREVAAYQGSQLSDVNYWPTVGDLNDVNVGQWYYWRIDEANASPLFDACGPVWSFKIKDVNAALPNPEDEGYAGPCPTLTWDTGYGAVEHRVYFDVNEVNVIGRVGPCTPLTEPTAESWAPPWPLDWDTQYFWAVDENDVCDVLTPGEVWSFTVPRDPCDGPAWRYEDDTFYAIWGFNDWDTGPNVAADYNSYPVGFYSFEPNCVDGPNAYLADYTPAGGTIRYHIADNNGPAGEVGENSIRLKHTDNAMPGQGVIIRAGLIWSGESSPTVVLERLTNWGAGPEPEGGWEAWGAGDNVKDNCEPEDPEFVIELCDGWMYSVYEVEFKLTEPADNIHVVIESDGVFYLDSVVVDAQWYTPPEAHGPRPADEAVDVPLDTCKLIWYPGVYVDDHNVYFSEIEALVADACDSVKVGNRQADPCYPPGAEDECLELEPGVTYYWRVDEVNDPCLWEGAVWSFTTTQYVVIDDFNHYTDDPNMSETWIDHSTQPTWGSYVYRSSNLVPDSNTSPPYAMRFQYYWKSTQPHIFTRRTFDPPQDWTKGGLAALVLQFRGDANSMFLFPAFEDRITATEMYVTLTDGQDNVWKEYYDGEANDLIANEWMEWNLALSDFNESPNNVDTTNIKSIDIGVSGIVMSANRLMGRIWFDDIRLYVPRCVPMYAVDISSDPEGEFAGAPDCFVDEWDLDAMFDDWVVGDMNVLSVDACDANLLVEYLFDPCDLPGTENDDLYDSSGNERHGIAINDVNVHAGMLTLVNVAEINDFNTVRIPLDANTFNKPFSIVMKVRIEPGSVLFGVSPPSPNDPCEESESYNSYDHAMTLFHSPECEFGEDVVVRDSSFISASGSITESGAADGGWHTVATTSDGNSGQVAYLVTGHQMRIEENPGFPEEGPQIWLPERHKVMIGYTYHLGFNDPEFGDFMGAEAMNGDVSELQIYDRVLSLGEIVYLSGVPAGEWLYMPVDSDADLYEDEPAATSLESTRLVNFKDYTFLMQYWLTWQPFPPEE